MDQIKFEDFLKIELRTGTILSAESIPKSKKLLKLTVNFGETIGNRTILAGISESFTPDALIGTRVVAVLNLEPRVLMGIESHGMLLAAKDDEGLHLVTSSCKNGVLVG